MALARSVTVMEVSPRDGLQNESVMLSTQDKLTLIHRGLAAGFRRIEVTSFVHPTRVPQMADAEAACAGLPQRGDVTYAGLILNRRGYDRARATQRLQEVGMVVPASNTFGARNQDQSVDESVAVGCEILRDAARRGLRATATIAVAFGCPFEGDVDVEHVLDIAQQLADAGPVELALADTTGVGVPGQVLELFGALRERLGSIPLRAHFHNTRTTGSCMKAGSACSAIAAALTTSFVRMVGRSTHRRQHVATGSRNRVQHTASFPIPRNGGRVRPLEVWKQRSERIPEPFQPRIVKR